MPTIRMKADQKKAVLLEIIRASGQFFKLSELESLGSKKGIAQNTIKDILQQLVDDGLVTAEKVGVSIFYWSFASSEIQKKAVKCANLWNKCNGMIEEIQKKKAYIDERRSNEECLEDRRALEERMEVLVCLEKNQQYELEKFCGRDPEVYDKLISDRKVIVDECNRIIENIFTTQDYVCNKFSIEKTEFNLNFGVPQDLDYVQ